MKKVHLKSFARILTSQVTNSPDIVLFFTLCLALLAAWPLGGAKVLTGLDLYFKSDDPELTYYEDYVERFANDTKIMIAFEDSKPLSKKALETIRDLGDGFKEFSGVARVISLDHLALAHSEGNEVDFRSIIPEEITGSDGERVLIEQKLRENHDITVGLVSLDRKAHSVILELLPQKDSEAYHRLAKQVKNHALRIAHEQYELRFASGLYIDRAITMRTSKDLLNFIPFALLIAFLASLILLRSFSLTLVSAAVIVTSLIITLGSMVALGYQFNVVAVVIGPVLVAISVADAVHMIEHYIKYFKINGGDHREAIDSMMEHLIKPCILTSLTTSIGYLTFAFSDIPVIQQVGLFMGLGCLVALLVCVLIIPAAIMIIKPKIKLEDPKSVSKDAYPVLDKVLSFIPNFTIRFHKAVLLLAFLLTAVMALGFSKLRYHSDWLQFIPSDDQVYQDVQFVNERLGGINFIELEVTADPSVSDFATLKGLKVLETIEQSSKAQFSHQIDAIQSILSFIRPLHQGFSKEKAGTLPASSLDVKDYLDLLPGEDTQRVINLKRNQTRMVFNLDRDLLNQVGTFETHMEQIFKDLPEGYRYRFTGTNYLYHLMEDRMQRSQITSVVLSIILITLSMYFVAGNLKLMIIAMLPNFFPMIAVMAFMGWAGIDLNLSTIMLASITIGLAVDDTIHFLSWYHRRIAEGLDSAQAIAQTFRDTGGAILTTSLILSGGFGVAITSSTLPLQNFGMLSVFGVAGAAFADLVILPPLLYIFDRGTKRERAVQEDSETTEEEKLDSPVIQVAQG